MVYTYCPIENLLMEGGDTKKRRQMPPMEKPMSCVDMTMSHWYVKLQTWP